MGEALQSAGIACTVSAMVALAVCWLGGSHYVAAAAFAAAYCAGSLFVRPWSELVPTRHFHWPFHLALVGAVLGPLAAAAESKRGFAWRWHLLGAIAAALVLVPTYKSLSPGRWVQAPLLAAYLFLLAAGLTPLFRRMSDATLVGLLSLSALTVAALTAPLVSLGFGTGALTAAAALAGCCAALWLVKRPEASAGLAVSYALVVGGWAYIAARQSSPWLWETMAAAAAPLALWVLAAGGASPKPGRWKEVAECSVVGTVLGAAVAWGWWTAG